MAKTILNFHFDYLNLSLMEVYIPKTKNIYCLFCILSYSGISENPKWEASLNDNKVINNKIIE